MENQLILSDTKVGFANDTHLSKLFYTSKWIHRTLLQRQALISNEHCSLVQKFGVGQRGSGLRAFPTASVDCPTSRLGGRSGIEINDRINYLVSPETLSSVLCVKHFVLYLFIYGHFPQPPEIKSNSEAALELHLGQFTLPSPKFTAT